MLTIIVWSICLKTAKALNVPAVLCMWCSIPNSKNATPKKEWKYETDFCNLHNEFSELVEKNGCSWFYRHIKSVAKFIKSNPDKVNKSVYDKVN
ncbi:MAG: hypothetical protein ACLUFN_03400 [Eubacterium sp.]